MANQYCANCGTVTVAGERFCGECGNDLTQPGSVTNAPPVNPANLAIPPYQPAPPIQPLNSGPVYQQGYGNTSPVPQRSSNPLPLIIGGVVLLAVLGVGGFFLLNGNKKSNDASTAAQATATPNAAVAVATATTPAVAAADSPTPRSSGSNADLRQEVLDASATMDALTGFHANYQSSISGTETLLDGDFSRSGSAFKGQYAGKKFDAIYIDDTGYVSTDEGKTWQLDSHDLASYAKDIYTLFTDMSLGADYILTDAGMVSQISGDRAHQIDIVEPSTSSKASFWIVDFQGSKAVSRLELINGTTSIKVDFSKFNQPVVVSAPDISK